MQATISAASASDSSAVLCASQMRTSTVPKLKCGRTDHQTWVNSTIERVRTRNSMYSRYAPQPPNASGTPQRGKLLVKLCVRAECSPVSRPSRIGRVGGDRQQQRQHRAQPVADAHRAVDVAHADVDVQAEGVVAPGDVLQPLLDAAVVLGVDDRLLAVVGPGMGPGGAERGAVGGGEREQAPAPLALARERVVQVGAGAGDDLDLRGDQLAGDALVQQPDRPPRRRAAPRSGAAGRACCGSRIENSSSTPTVKSVAAANVSSARSRSRLVIARCRPVGQIAGRAIASRQMPVGRSQIGAVQQVGASARVASQVR